MGSFDHGPPTEQHEGILRGRFPCHRPGCARGPGSIHCLRQWPHCPRPCGPPCSPCCPCCPCRAPCCPRGPPCCSPRPCGSPCRPPCCPCRPCCSPLCGPPRCCPPRCCPPRRRARPCPPRLPRPQAQLQRGGCC